MRFTDLHKLVSYLLVLSAVAALLLSPEISPLTAVLALSSVALSWFAEPSRLRIERYTVFWNIATVLFFFYLVVDVIRGESVLVAGAHFLLVVLVNKLFNRSTSKDYQQAYVISFLLLVVSTTLNTDLSYAVCFSLFALFITWALSLLHLRREIEENYLLKHGEGGQSEKVEVERILHSRRVVSRAFLLGTSGIWVATLLGAALIFFLFPRIGFGLFISQKRGGIALAGFQERVELGHHGTIRDNPSVVMRVVLPQDAPGGKLRWRGAVFDHYQNGVWSHGEDTGGRTEPLVATDGLYRINHAPGLSWETGSGAIRSGLLRQEIYLEPLDSTVIFAADRPVAIESQRSGLGPLSSFAPRRGIMGEIHRLRSQASGLRYVAYSYVHPVAAAVLRRSGRIDDPRWSRYLQLPTQLPRRIGDLARRIAADRPTVFDQVQAVLDHLRRNYRYTLKLTHDPRYEPVDEFLFVTRRGHCEYFASSMTLLLRHLGIHSRSVNGFAGGEWNRFGRYLAVRQGDAHAWVEVLFEDVGWVTFDPTPASPVPGTDALGLTSGLRQALDTLRLRWFRHVVEYDLRQQVSIFLRLQRAFHHSGVSKSRLLQKRTLLGLGAAAALVVAAILLWKKYRPLRAPLLARFRQRSAPPAASILYARLLGLLARAGQIKPIGVTPQEFAEGLARQGFAASKLVERFTRCYYEVRYGEQPLSESVRQELRSLLEQVQQALRTEGR
jgi:protein-glutamine gamma-glutamyltransferase